MQISFILAELSVPEDEGTLQIIDSIRPRNSKAKQKLSKVGLRENTNIYPRISSVSTNWLRTIQTCFTYSAIYFLKNRNNFMPYATFAKGFRH